VEFQEWIRLHSVGDPLLDAYHHIFFQAVDEMERAGQAQDRDAVRDRLNFLRDYALMHFHTEEGLLAKAGYPGLEEHKAAHQIFKERIEGLIGQLDEEPATLDLGQIGDTARTWLRDHILEEDMKFKPFIGA